MNFVAIDFETATQRRDSACAVGIVTVHDGLVVERFSALIQPPHNWYNLDFSRDIYGQEIEVVFHWKLRGEQKFASAAALQEQIAADIGVARRLE